MTNANNPFDPASNYTAPKSEGNYLKFGAGSTEFLALASPIIGWQYWNTEKKPVRLRIEPVGNFAELPGIKVEDDGKYKVQHFWAFPVIDVVDGKVKILEITQKSVQNDIRAYIKNPRWGSPVMKYTFSVAKTGEKLETKYTVMANPLATVPQEWVQAWNDTLTFGFNLDELFTGGDPFKPSTPAPVAPVATPVAPAEPTIIHTPNAAPTVVLDAPAPYPEDTATPPN
jgi:hypothetical protein